MKHHFPLPHCSLAQGIIYLELFFICWLKLVECCRSVFHFLFSSKSRLTSITYTSTKHFVNAGQFNAAMKITA